MYIRRPLDRDKAKDRHLIELVKLTTKGVDKLTYKQRRCCWRKETILQNSHSDVQDGEHTN